MPKNIGLENLINIYFIIWPITKNRIPTEWLVMKTDNKQ